MRSNILIPYFKFRGVSQFTYGGHLELDTLNRGNPTSSILGFQYQQSFHHNNKSYLTWMSRNGDVYDNENFVDYLDHTSRTLSISSTTTSKTNETLADHHAHGTIFITSTGRILVFRTEHISPIYVAYTDNLANGFTEGANFSTLADYMQINERDGVIYVHCRRQDGSFKGITAYKSEDDGTTWTTIGPILDMADGSGKNLVAYPDTNPHDHVNGKMWILIAESNRTDSCFHRNGVMWTYDYVTFYNIDSSWSKDVGTNGQVTATEFWTNCVVENIAISTSARNWFQASTISDTGNLYLLKRNNTTSGTDFCYWNGTQWIITEITTNWTIDSNCSWYGTNLGDAALYSINDNTFDAFLFEEMPSGLLQINRYRTTDKGVNWAFQETITNTNVDHFRHMCMTRNIQTSKKGIIACNIGNGGGVINIENENPQIISTNVEIIEIIYP